MTTTTTSNLNLEKPLESMGRKLLGSAGRGAKADFGASQCQTAVAAFVHLSKFRSFWL